MSLEQIENILNNLSKNIASSSQVKAALKTSAVSSVMTNFEEGGRPIKWDPSEKTKKNNGSRTLIDSGDMSMIQAETEESSDGLRLVLMPGPLAKAYSRIQNEGGVINMPGRQLRFRKNKNGKTVFAKNSHKRVDRETISKPYNITIPKREYLIIPEQDYGMILDNVRSAVTQSISKT